MGGAITRACARAGLRVLGCDCLSPPHTLGSSHGESRIIRAAYFEDPVYAPMAQRSMQLWRELEREANRTLVTITGGLNIGPAQGMLVHGALTSAREHNVAHELLESRDIMRRFPGFAVRPDDVAIYEPDAGILNPEACIAAQIRGARVAGADILIEETVLDWEKRADHFDVHTTHGVYAARQIVLATGAWLPRFRPSLPLTVTRQPVFWFEPRRPQLYRADVCAHYLIEFEPGRVFYGFPDLGTGVKCAVHHEGRPTSVEAVDRELNAAERETVAALLREFLPDAAGPMLRHSVCLYTNSPNGHFIVDRAADSDGVWIVSACSGHGFKFAPAIAELVTDCIANNAAPPAVFQWPSPRSSNSN